MIDGGGGYTYFDPQTGHATLGRGRRHLQFHEDPSTNYQNGIDGHLDLASHRISFAELPARAVGYVYDQITGDSGSGNKVGPLKSRVMGVGPTDGLSVPAAGMHGYLNLKVIPNLTPNAVERPATPMLTLLFARGADAAFAHNREVLMRDI